MAYKQTLALDFDGVLHNYTGWNGGVLGEPLTNARHACKLLARHFKLVCFTARENTGEVADWLRRHGFPLMEVTREKGPYFLLVDDRALLFEGLWTDALLNRILHFQPYWHAQQSASLPEEPQLPPRVIEQSLADGQLPDSEPPTETETH